MLVSVLLDLYVIFFFKQKTAYEMRISDWSSDVCSSDLYDADDHLRLIRALGDDPGVLSHMYNALSLWFLGFPERAEASCRLGLQLASRLGHAFSKIGRASCRERVCQYV